MTLNIDLEDSYRIGFIGIDDYKAGTCLAGLAHNLTRSGENVSILSGSKTIHSQSQRINGFLDTMKQYPEILLSNVIYTEDKLEISNKLLKEMLSKKYYKTIVMVDSWLANAGEVIAQTGYDDINILGFDLMPQNKEALKQGKVTYIIDQSAYMQSYECVHKVCEHLIYGTELPKGKNYLPIHIYNKYNLDLIAIIIGIPAGILAGVKKINGKIGQLNFFTTLGVAVPSFVVAALLIYVLSTKLHLLPAAMWNGWRYEIMPALALSGMPMSFIARLTRSSMLDILSQDYIKTARAKGLSWSKVLIKHALPNSLIPVVTYLGPMTASILTGSFVIETIFAIPGLGQYFVTSIYNRDYTVILGVTIFYSVIVIVLNMVVDLLYPLLDPRIKIGEEKGE